MRLVKKNRSIVVITGASAGVGRAVVREFAKRGARIGLIARGIDRLDETRAEVEKLGGEALILPADVADPEAISECAKKVESAYGPIDIWINNAMVSVYAPIKETPPEEFRRVMEVTFLGYVNGTKAALSSMLPRDRGTIVQVGSALSYRSIPLQSAYCAAKHAILGFTNSLHSELIHDRSNLKLTTVHLPAVNTPQFQWAKSRLSHLPRPVSPVFQPEIVEKSIFYAAYHPKREYWIGLPTTKAILVEKFLPRLGDWFLGKRGYSAQETSSQPTRASSEGNLWESVPGSLQTHGPFDFEAHSFSLPMWLGRHRRSGLLTVAAAGLAAFSMRLRS
ncbi:MAG: short-chain dehydrogenase [Bdellovibrionales bacterium GWB1_55_8]|nr:MAG: short-chain dehydrogenase [Bdellovibrionales bacterium GWB1_55_8]